MFLKATDIRVSSYRMNECDHPANSRFWTRTMTCSLAINFLLDAIHALLRYCGWGGQ